MMTTGGQTLVENCQVLQTRVNRIKGNATDMTYDTLRQNAVRMPDLSGEEMDKIEMSTYGDVSKPPFDPYKVRVSSKQRDREGTSSKTHEIKVSNNLEEIVFKLKFK